MLQLTCVVGRLGRGKKRTGDYGRGKEKKRGSRLSPLPIVQRALTTYNHFYFHWNTHCESLCRGESLQIILLHLLISFLNLSNVKECELAMKSTSLLSCFLVDTYGQVEMTAYF